MLPFYIGAVIGFCIGFCAAALMASGTRSDERIESFKHREK